MSSTSIDSQTWSVIQQTNQALRAEAKRQARGDERIAESNCSTKTLAGLQEITKDVVLTTDPQARKSLFQANTANSADSKPPLPAPFANWDALKGVGSQEPGLISIMGSVLCLQAKTNSNFWSTLWKQASTSMQMEVKFAPIIGSAINAAYQAQSAATNSQSQQSYQEGMVSLAMFGIAMGMAGYLEINSEENPLNEDKNDVDYDEDKNTSQASPDSEGAQMENLDEQTDDEIKQEDESWKDRAKRYLNIIKEKGTLGQKRFTSFLGRGLQAAQTMSMLSEGVTRFFITSKYQAQQAGFQSTEGTCQALSKESEQYAQFYGQDFSRGEDLRQGSGQNLDYAMNILKSAADSITQTVTSMFRG